MEELRVDAKNDKKSWTHISSPKISRSNNYVTQVMPMRVADFEIRDEEKSDLIKN